MSERRAYGHCAKCGAEKDLDPNFVGACCHGTPGVYSHCAVGGEPLTLDSRIPGSPPYTGRCYVCFDHLARPVPA
jgi:hypothetical protein